MRIINAGWSGPVWSITLVGESARERDAIAANATRRAKSIKGRPEVKINANGSVTLTFRWLTGAKNVYNTTATRQLTGPVSESFIKAIGL